jgi:putative FmdB family regulatory protein
MPLYEYVCNKCGNKFEYLQGQSEKDVRIACPNCESGNVTKVFSAFSTSCGDGGCGGGTVNRGWRFG